MDTNRSSTVRRLLRLLTPVIGLALFAQMIARTGAANVVDHLKAVGWGMALVLALGGLFHLVRALAWRLTFRSDVSELSVARAFGLRLISEAVGTFGLAGQMVGDSMRVSLLGPAIPMDDRISSVALDRAVYIVSSGTVAVAGILAAVVLLSLGGVWRVYALGFAAAVTIVLVLALFSFANGWRLFSHLAGAIQRLPWSKKMLAEKASIIELAERDLLSFRLRGPGVFWAVIGLYFVSQMLAIAEVYLLLRLMGIGLAPVGAFAIEALTKLTNIVGALNPGNIGTYEGGNLVIARLLHFPTTAGLTLALCRRARILFWAAVGSFYLMAWSPRKEEKAVRA